VPAAALPPIEDAAEDPDFDIDAHLSSADLFVPWVGLRALRQEPQVHDGEYCAGFEHRNPVHPALPHRGLCEAQSRPTAMAVSPVFARITS
jgi:hypothetical protein